jgi:hypothetical protein
MLIFRKSQTRREAGTESHGSLSLREIAGLPGKAALFLFQKYKVRTGGTSARPVLGRII